jgi:hypothetical protein
VYNSNLGQSADDGGANPGDELERVAEALSGGAFLTDFEGTIAKLSDGDLERLWAAFERRRRTSSGRANSNPSV